MEQLQAPDIAFHLTHRRRKSECLADALDNRTEFGVWGGMTERERRALLKRRPDVRQAERELAAAVRRKDMIRQEHPMQTPFAVPKAARTILVAGGAGFLGSHLCDRLLDEGHTVVCLDNLLTGDMAGDRDVVVVTGRGSDTFRRYGPETSFFDDHTELRRAILDTSS